MNQVSERMRRELRLVYNEWLEEIRCWDEGQKDAGRPFSEARTWEPEIEEVWEQLCADVADAYLAGPRLPWPTIAPGDVVDALNDLANASGETPPKQIPSFAEFCKEALQAIEGTRKRCRLVFSTLMLGIWPLGTSMEPWHFERSEGPRQALSVKSVIETEEEDGFGLVPDYISASIYLFVEGRVAPKAIRGFSNTIYNVIIQASRLCSNGSGPRSPWSELDTQCSSDGTLPVTECHMDERLMRFEHQIVYMGPPTGRELLIWLFKDVVFSVPYGNSATSRHERVEDAVRNAVWRMAAASQLDGPRALVEYVAVFRGAIAAFETGRPGMRVVPSSIAAEFGLTGDAERALESTWETRNGVEHRLNSCVAGLDVWLAWRLAKTAVHYLIVRETAKSRQREDTKRELGQALESVLTEGLQRASRPC